MQVRTRAVLLMGAAGLLAAGGLMAEESVTALDTGRESGAQAAPAPAPAEPPKEDTSFKVSWKKGIKFETADGAYKVGIGGRFHQDWFWFDADDELKDDFGDHPDGTEFRRIRFEMGGSAYKNFDFKIQMDFAGGEAAVKDLYVGLHKMPVIGSLRMGHFHEPLGLELQSSSNVNTFMERAPNGAFGGDRHSGVRVGGGQLDNRMTWWAGVFRRADDFGMSTGDGEYVYDARVTGLPYYENDGKEMAHIGVSASHLSPTNNAVRYRSRPSSHLTPRYVDTGAFAAKSANTLGLELLGIYGALSVQGEYTQVFVDAPGTDDNPNFFAAYGEISYFLTGENRKYKMGDALLDSPSGPKNRFWGGEGTGAGAWQLAFRYSTIDLDSEGVTGGSMNDYVIGVNWYWNENFRILFNYVLTDVEESGQLQAFQMRLSLFF